jgi:hypothetical protein
LEGGDEEERLATVLKMVGEGAKEASGRAEPIRAAVEGQVHPGVRIPLGLGRRKVRRIRQDPVEPAEAGREVGPDDLDREPLLPGLPREPVQRDRIAVGRHDPPARAGGREAGEPPPAADLEQAARPGRLGERKEQERVLPDRIDGALRGIARGTVGS